MLQKEQDGIKGSISAENRGLTWEDTRRMPLTSRVRTCIYIFDIKEIHEAS